MLNLKLFKNIFLYGIGDFIVTGVTAFLFIPLYLQFLNPDEYGVFNILNNNLVLFTYIFQFGIISAFGRIYFLKKAENQEKKYTWNVILFHIVFSFCLIIIYILFKSFIINQLSPSVSDSRLVYYSPLMAFITFLPGLYYVYLRLENKVSQFVFFQILTVSTVSLLILISFIFFKINLLSILFSFIVGNLIVWFIVIFKLKFRINVNLKDIVETVRFAFPIFISYLAFFFASKYSVIILQKYVSLSEIGFFSLAQQIASIPTLITVAITKAVQPILYSAATDDELQSKSQKFDYIFKLGLIWIIGSLIFLMDFFFPLLFPVKYLSIITITKYSLIINLLNNFSVVEGTILFYKMKTNIVLLITLITSMVNVIFSNYLVQFYVLNGVLVAMGIAFFVNFCMTVYFSRKHIKINYDLKAVVLCFLIIIIYFFASSSHLFIAYKSILSISCFLILTTLVLLIFKQKYASIQNKSI